MDISKLRARLIKYPLDAFNDQVLSRIKDKETGLMYVKDVRAASVFGRTVLDNHSAQLSEEKKAALQKTVDALDELAKALEDFKIEPDELDVIIDKVKEAVDAWKKAK